MERIVLVARLQFGMFPVGADAVQVNRVFRRWVLRIARVLRGVFPWNGMACRRLRLLRRMTLFRTSGVGTCLLWLYSEVGMLLLQNVYGCP